MKKAKARTPEYLSKDILDKEFVGTYKLIHGLQFILGSCRIEVKDQFVTSPTSYQRFYTILCILITLLLNIVTMDSYYQSFEDPTMYYLGAMTIWLDFVIFICVITNVRFCNKQSNSDFFIQMQQIDRIMGIDKIKMINLISRRVNIFSLVMLMGVFIVMSVVIGMSNNMTYMAFVGSMYAQLTCMIEIIHCSNLLIYFVMRLRFLNAIIKNHLTQMKKEYKNRPLNIWHTKYLRKFAIQTHDFATSDTHVYLKELFELFSNYQNLYRFQLFIFCLKLILGSLCSFAVTLFSIQRNASDVVQIWSIFLFTIIDLFSAISLGIRLQFFFGEVKETKRLSIAVMAEYSNGELRDKARKMLKMTEETPPRLSIYDMYDMDAGIFLTVFSLITSLIVTLLQFALL